MWGTEGVPPPRSRTPSPTTVLGVAIGGGESGDGGNTAAASKVRERLSDSSRTDECCDDEEKHNCDGNVGIPLTLPLPPPPTANVVAAVDRRDPIYTVGYRRRGRPPAVPSMEDDRRGDVKSLPFLFRPVTALRPPGHLPPGRLACDPRSRGDFGRDSEDSLFLLRKIPECSERSWWLKPIDVDSNATAATTGDDDDDAETNHFTNGVGENRDELSPTEKNEALSAVDHIRRTTVAVAGSTLVVTGIILFPVPIVPGVVFIYGGLVVLASEFKGAQTAVGAARKPIEQWLDDDEDDDDKQGGENRTVKRPVDRGIRSDSADGEDGERSDDGSICSLSWDEAISRIHTDGSAEVEDGHGNPVEAIDPEFMRMIMGAATASPSSTAPELAGESLIVDFLENSDSEEGAPRPRIVVDGHNEQAPWKKKTGSGGGPATKKAVKKLVRKLLHWGDPPAAVGELTPSTTALTPAFAAS